MLLSLCVLSSCAPRVSQLPPIPPPSEAPHDDPARDAQSRLLKEAHRAFVQERYPSAALFFRRFVDNAPDSPRLAEARWWLGRAYEQLGDYRAAIAQYRMVAAGPLLQQLNGTLYEGHALRRLDELRQLHAGQHNGRARQRALRVTVGQLPPIPALRPWLQELVQGDVTALVIGPAQALLSDGVGLNLEIVKRIVTEAHHLGLLLWVAVDLHQRQGMDLRPEWATTTITGLGGEGASTPRPDIANPAYQSYLEETIRALSRTGCDGVFLAARPVAGFAGEFSDGSFRAFASSFGLSLSPKEMFTVNQLPDAQTEERPATYWRWVGWKALSYAKLIVRLRKVLRESNPTATMLLEVHQVTLSTPLQGLEQYGEDLAELVTQGTGSVVVRREGEGGEALLEKLGQQLGTVDRVWVGVSAKVAASPPSMEGLTQSLAEIAEPGRWNIMVVTESADAVP